MSPRVPLATLVLPLAASCFSPLQVRDAAGVEQPGLLFYAKRGVHRQTTERVTTWVEARLSVLVFEKKPDGTAGALVGEFAEVRGVNDANRNVLAEVKAKLVGAPGDPAAILTRFAEGMTGKPKTDPKLVANAIDVVAVPDYGSPLHLRLRTPVFGTSTFKPDISQDGTLGKLETSVTSTPEKAADLIPAKELLTKVFGLGADEQKLVTTAASTSHVLKLALAVDEVGVREVWTYDWPEGQGPLANRERGLEPLYKAQVPASYKRLPLGAPKPETKEPEGYTFSGKLTLPKEKG